MSALRQAGGHVIGVVWRSTLEVEPDTAIKNMRTLAEILLFSS